jgi:hypothetical protein
MELKKILLLIFVGISFILVFATVFLAFQESSQTAGLDLEQYHARVDVTRVPTLAPTATPVEALPTVTPTLSGMFDED